ncbi:non-ribosomal peptide synthetase [Amycolatopsis sp. H20-H5]|uniref:non-ribosomal peptide synthetase n=1 Tax=Amycolatopsis sp. H20-H5 TaxID=3046309 RepID=UPI002DB9F3D2|nr:non-ribosomal peptide synthetase [Amycolatopsis sp. H20-H5]MEC3980970.1 amino acid adenylation domain-containing protein [Amycolatopsis sp. H20-H5]
MTTKDTSLGVVLPLTPLQEGLLFHSQYDDHGPDVYVMQLGMDIDGPLDPAMLRDAAYALLDRHANLRAGFRHEGVRPLQFVPPSIELPWHELDLTDLPAEELDEALRELTEADRATRFDLRRPPLLRFTVVRTGPERHRLLVTNHHILFDGWSAPILVRELFELYAAGGDISGMPRVTPYRYHLAWLAKQDHEAATTAWRTALDGLDGPTMLAHAPDDRSAAVLPAKVSARLSPETTARLTERVREHGLTLNTVVQAAWGLLLGRLTDRADVTFGMTLAGRPPEIPGVHTMVGLFLNTVPVRVSIDPAESLLALCERVQDEQRKLMSHQHLGLAEIQRLAGHGELFDTLTVLENFPVDPAALTLPCGLSVVDVFSTDGAHYPLALMVIPGSSLELRFTYRPDLFGEAEMEVLAARLAAVMGSFVADPSLPEGRVDVLAPVERSRLLEQWNPAAATIPARTLPEVLAGWAADGPEHEALVCGAESLTRAELADRVHRVAAWLVERGVGAEEPVGVSMERSIEFVVAVLAVIRAGGAYVPLDHRWPRARRDDVLADAGIRIVLQSGDLPAHHPLPAGGLPLPPGPDRIAYVMYTSGSTGRPKGVAITHRGIADLAADSRFAGGGHERVLLQSAHAFDASTYEMWIPLLGGGTLVVGPPGELDVATIARTITEQRVTSTLFTTGLFRLIAAESPECLAGLREVWTGGEAVPATAVRQVLAACPDTTVVDAYGPTEVTVIAAAHRLRDAGQVPDPVPIGEPLDGKRVYVLDSALRLCPVGVAGELYVSGVGLARGYLGRPGLSSERFVADPFGDNGSRLYRTGDVVRWRPDGLLEFVGRRDNQVKLRGFRIELGEIESVLAEHDAVRQVAVMVREDRPGVRQLVGYLVPDREGEFDIEFDIDGLRAWAGERLPEYMVPQSFVVLEALPLTTNGKLDTAALPEPELVLTEARGPRTPHEELLCGLFSEVLGLSSVSVDDSFFALGGHSLLATRLVSRVRAVLGVELPIRAVFEEPTVAALAVRVAGTTAGGRAALRPAERPERVPLSFAQRRLWFLNLMEGPSSTYNIPFAVRLSGELDVAALRAAFADLIGRHESLRTVFPDVDGEAWQRVVPAEEAAVAFEVTEVPQAGLAAALVAAGSTGFDLAVDLPVRAWLFAVGEDEHVLCVVLHHIAGDGWSQAPLARDLGAAYAARVEGVAPDWRPLPVQYADYALWQRDLLGTDEDKDSLAANQLAYWADTLADALPALTLPADRPRPPVATHRGDSVGVRVDAELHASLRALAAKTDTTPFMVFQSALAALLTRLGAGEDISIGTPVAGRLDAATDDLIGYFVNTLVLRTDTSGDPAFVDLLRRARATALGAYAHQDLPFERLVDLVGADRSLSYNPLFQVMLAYQNNEISEFALPGLRVDVEDVLLPIAKVDLELSVVEEVDGVDGAGGMSGILTYSTDLFDRTSAERIAGCLVTLLRAVAADPTRPLHTIEVIDPAERELLLGEWSPPVPPVPVLTVPELFAAQVAAKPGHEAVVCGTESLTYAEFDDRVQRVGAWLLERGMGPEEPVAILMERSIDYLVAALAVVRAGGAYVPLDHRWPPARREDVLADAGIRIVLQAGDLPEHHPLPAGGLPMPQAPDRLAYVIYTSGSTGRPKGVQVSHRALADFAADTRFANGAHDRVLMHTAHAFDVSCYEIWVPLLNGGTVVVAPPGELDVATVSRVITAGRVTATWFTVGLFRMLTAEGPDCFAGLTELWVGGEAVPAGPVRQVREACPDTIVVNGYGPTEAVIFAASHRLSPAEPVPDNVPIGRPLDGTRAYVLDAGLRLCPVGVAGELYVSGVGLARGYLGRPGLTSERFVADPFGDNGSRLYRTGDVVRWRQDGLLEYLGRRDNQVKLRGFRIELGEIESVLAEHDAVRQAAVVVREDRPGVRQLVGYLVAGHEGEFDIGQLRTWAGERLPEYMVPQAFVVLDALPLTTNGKFDEKALPAPELTAVGESRAASTDAEKVLAEVFTEVLALPEVGVDANFFELGGDSIMSIKVVSQARRAGLVITPREVFEHRSVAGLALVARPVDEVSLDDPDAGIGDVPLTPVTHWLRGLGGSIGRFHQTVLVRVPRTVRLDALTTAVRQVMDHHDTLRLRLDVAENGEWSYEVRPRGAVSVTDCVLRVDVAGLGRDELRAVLAEQAGLAAGRLSPETGVMLQAVWFDAGPDEPGQLLVSGHHLAVDGVSWRILMPDLAAAWQAAAQGRTAELQPVGTSWRRWAQRLTELAVQPARAAQVAWWTEQLRGEDALVTTRPKDLATDTMGTLDSLAATLPETVTAPLLSTVPSAAGSGVQDVLLAAFALAIADWRRRRGLGADTTVLVDVERHGRQAVPGLDEDIDVSRTVGWFTSIAPVRLDLGPVSWGRVYADPAALRKAVGRVKETLHSTPDEGIGFGLVRYLNPGTRDELAALGSAQFAFNYLGRAAVSEERGAEPDTTDWTMSTDSEVLRDLGGDPGMGAPHSLSLNVVVEDAATGPRLVANWTWPRALLAAEDVRLLADGWFRALTALAEHVAERESAGFTPSDLSLIDLELDDIGVLEAEWRKQ